MDNDDDPLPYAMTAALARSIVIRYTAGDRACLPALFLDLEEMLTREGISSEDKELLVVGFIEDLQGAIGWARLDAKPFYALLGPKSRVAWDDLMKMWDEIARKKASGELQPGVAMPEVEDAGLRKLVQQIFRPPTK